MFLIPLLLSCWDGGRARKSRAHGNEPPRLLLLQPRGRVDKKSCGSLVTPKHKSNTARGQEEEVGGGENTPRLSVYVCLCVKAPPTGDRSKASQSGGVGGGFEKKKKNLPSSQFFISLRNVLLYFVCSVTVARLHRRSKATH